MKSQKRIGYLLTIATIFILGCDISTLVAPQSIPASAPGNINTIVAQTAAAAATQTAALNPPSALGVINTIVVQTAAAAATQTAALIPPTLTPSFTPFPTQTASITPTATQTFIFRMPTAVKPTSTKTPVPASSGGSSGGGGGGSSGGGGGGGSTTTWSCKWVSQTPANSTHFAPGTGFNANWTVKNTGDITWIHTTVDIIYSSGAKLSTQLRFDTTADTSVGSTYVVSVPMTAPATAGTYSMTWSLQAGATTFCSMPLTILVP
jgi:hypothetical protein